MLKPKEETNPYQSKGRLRGVARIDCMSQGDVIGWANRLIEGDIVISSTSLIVPSPSPIGGMGQERFTSFGHQGPKIGAGSLFSQQRPITPSVGIGNGVSKAVITRNYIGSTEDEILIGSCTFIGVDPRAGSGVLDGEGIVSSQASLYRLENGKLQRNLGCNHEGHFGGILSW
jgi:hypothetical protein